MCFIIYTLFITFEICYIYVIYWISGITYTLFIGLELNPHITYTLLEKWELGFAICNIMVKKRLLLLLAFCVRGEKADGVYSNVFHLLLLIIYI